MNSGKNYHPFFKGARIIGMVVLGLVTAVIFGLLFGFFVEILWNWLMPPIFGLTKITYWQAFGLIFLAKLIFGSGHHFGRHHYHHGHYEHWHSGWRRHYDDVEWKLRGGWQDWRYYDEWWKDEGKEAFEKYINDSKHKETNIE